MDAPHLGEQGREDVEADGHPADQARSCPRSDSCVSLIAGDRVLQILEDAVAQLEQRLAGRRDADAPADAMEDRLAELVFEQQDLAADGRLGDVQLFAGGRERAGFGNGADDFELPEIHESAYMRDSIMESILATIRSSPMRAASVQSAARVAFDSLPSR